MSRKMSILVIILPCCMMMIAMVACFLMLRALRQSVARQVSLRASLVRQKEALQQAERKSLSKTEAFVGASHDIRSALVAITGLVDMSRAEARTNPKMMHNLDHMDICTKKLLGILNSILDTSKVESGKMQLEEAEFNLANILEESVDMINVVGVSKGLEVVWDPCDLSILNCGNVIGDCRRFKQILDNLLGNSVKFTQEGHVILRAWANKPIARSSICVPSRFVFPSPVCDLLCLFKTREHHAHQHSFSSIQNDPNAMEFYFEVDDTGIGIPKEKRELVFENYVQVKEGRGGTGLGLGIVQSFVRLMGGEISIKDKGPGERGTCIGFNVFMKMGAVQEVHDIEQGRPISSLERSDHQIRGLPFKEVNSFEGIYCVLLVHGDETQKILQTWMENLGLKVWLVPQVESLPSALEKVCHDNVSLARTSSSSFACRTDHCLKSRDTVNQILPIPLTNSKSFRRGMFGGHSYGVLVVIDAHYGKIEDMCAEMNLVEIKQRIPCRVVCLADVKISSADLTRFGHSCCDLVLQKPIHGSRLYDLLKILSDLQVSQEQEPCNVVGNPETSTPGSSRAGTSGIVAHLAPEARVEDEKPLTGTHVLLVEDTLTLQSIGKRMLCQLGATVGLAEDGSKAVSMFKAALAQAGGSEMDAVSTPYDVVLMDCQMPVMDGYEATRLIRDAESSYGIRTPIISLTAHSMEEELQKTIVAGMDLHLTKPMERSSIVEAIRRVCGGQVLRTDAATLAPPRLG
ncbi:hypothetical protein ACP70R_021331 [Stipagrostis hirtigluma subsp. patula]